MKTRLTLISATLALFLVAPSAPAAGYLFVTFKGEGSPLEEQVYFAVSEDGRRWESLNNSDPVLVSRLGEQGVRDPYLLRSHDGESFYLIATDLSIHRNPDWGRAVRAGSHSVVIWKSSDLATWSEPRLVEVAPEDAGCTWAPEAVYDDESGDYLVFWASTTGRDQFAKHRIWAARTRDFTDFSEPFIYIDKPTTVIDTTIVREAQTYYRFTKDEKHKAITMESAQRLLGPWSDVPGFSLSRLEGYEGPACYPVQSSTESGHPAWSLILDNYARGRGYQPYVTIDLASGRFEPGEGFEFPFRFRHGSVIPITTEELHRLREAY